MKKTILYVSVAAIIISTSCKKSDDVQNTPVPISYFFSPSSQEYVNLTPGKYLVYKDSASGDLDSIIVTRSELSSVTIPGYPSQGVFDPGSPGYIIYSMKLTLTKVSALSQNVWFDGSAVASSASDDAINKMYEMNSGGSSIHATITTEPPISSITVETKTYTDVIKSVAVTAVDINHHAYNESTLYWTKKIGIIKRRIVTGGGTVKTYNLLRNN